MLNKKFFVFCLFLLALIPLVFADDSYKPYLHKPSVPEHPSVNLYGKYSTNLFPGAGTYNYEIEFPKGTNNLQPSISISYNSQSVKQRPSILGAGWVLTQNYIYRDVNFTPSNSTDDEFKLILNNANYDLIFDNSDNYYHTEIETFARIENLSHDLNIYNMHWLLTLKDGTKLRFGYNNDSELTSNVGYSYALKWSLDQIEDTHGNKIFYSYLEDPHPEDNGSSYLEQILYNNDEKRKIEFSYENSNRPDRRLVYEQGNKLEESRRLADISVIFNDSLVRRYNFSYVNLNDEKSLSSVSKIKYFGSDNTSLLHQVTFDYYEANSYYTNSTTFNVTALFADSAGDDQGVRLIDLNNDGYIDIIQGKESGSIKNASINNKTTWFNNSVFNPPEFFTDTGDVDNGLRIAHLNNDGLPDLIYGKNNDRNAWLNNGSGWKEEKLTWEPDIDFVIFNDPNFVDNGVRLVDFNGDGRIDLIQSRFTNSIKNAYLNTGSGWKNASSVWNAPTFFVRSDWNDYGSRLVDVNGDGLTDIIQGYNFGSEIKAAWLNNGSGWINSTVWIPPVIFTSTSKIDNGVRLVDLNGDGLVDIIEDFANASSVSRDAWINNGSGWVSSTSWQSPEPFTKSGKNRGRRLGDVNGDGFADILVGYKDGSNDIKRIVIRNSTIPYLLKNITNEFGGLTNIDYTKSTKYNNTGSDGLSDIGFNVWVVEAVTQDNNIGKENNSINGKFNILSNNNYSYFGGLYDYNDSEFRGFNIVNETLADNSTIEHHFFQTDALKGKEFETNIYDSSDNLFSKTENNYNVTKVNTSNIDNFVIHLDSVSFFTYDGNLNNPKITNISYRYDNYSNVIEKISHGDILISGDEKYERYEFIYNVSPWILDKVSKYTLFASDNETKLRETKYYYDDKILGYLTLGDLTKTEEFLDDDTGNPTVYYNYDSFGNLYQQTDALGRTTTRDYGSKDATNTYPDRVTNELGHAIDYNYDVGTGNINSFKKHGVDFFFEYDKFGRILKNIDPYDTSLLPTKEYDYSFDGVAPEIIVVKQKTTSNNTLDTYYYYDGFANLIQIKTSAEDGQVVKNIFYDGLFRVKEEQNPYFDDFKTELSNVSNITNTTKYNYDSLSRITSVINPDGTTKNTTYDHWNITDIDENNNKKQYNLDSYERIIEVKEFNTDFYIEDNETYNTTYSYNGADELVSIKDNYGNEFNFTYDSLGRKTQLDDPDLGKWKYGYDFAGNLIKQTDNKGNVIDISYDGLNRIKEKNTSSLIISFAYDKEYHGTLSNISINNSIAYNYKYDDRLRVIKELLTARHHSFETGFMYDSADRILEKRLPDNDDLDYYYDLQGKTKEIKGYINDTKFNPFGNPLNRTYFNSKLTEFDYYSDNARLKQIKTDTVQNLNYSYDAVGNVMNINDSVNNRTYSMSYDNLDRLTNVSINSFKWVYSYDALGNILKIVRNFSKTTSFKFESGLAHAPSKVLTKDTGVDVYRESLIQSSNKTKQYLFYLVNERNETLDDINWTVEFGDSSSESSGTLLSLNKSKNVLVIVNHTYGSDGNFKINLTGKNNTASDYESFDLILGAVTKTLSVIKKNSTLIFTEFSVENKNNNLSENWGWNCSNGVHSTRDFNMSSDQGLLVIMEHNYSLNNIKTNITCIINSTGNKQNLTLNFNIEGLDIFDYNSTKVGINTVEVQFQIKNLYSTLNVSWNITAHDIIIQSPAEITLDQGQITTVIQEINFTNRGVKPVVITAYSGNFTDTYQEDIRLFSLGIEDFLNIVKNGTTRIFNFLVKNDWIDVTATWNISDPGLENIVNLTNNESLIVVIEENFKQGKKDAVIKVFNSTFLEDTLIEIFTIKEIGINEFETLYQNDSWAITSALVVNNIEKLNLSWKLNNTQELLISNKNLELNTSQIAFVVIESNFSESGVYPLTFMINSSSLNDNETGVAVS